MKKTATVLIMLAVLLFITNGVAQVQLGLQAGANFGDVTLDPTPVGVETSNKTGFLFGGVLFYSFSPIVGLQIEPAYVQKGAKADQTETDEGMTLKLERTLNADYLDIPVLLKASFGDGPVKPYLLAGATVAFLLGDANFEIDKLTLNGQDVLSMLPSELKEELKKVDVKSTDFILNFGGGVIIPLGQVNIFAEAQYNLGLSDVNDEELEPGEQETTIKSTGIQIKAGVLFPLN
jgi:hypothetical protein